MQHRIYQICEYAVTVEMGDSIDPAINDELLRLHGFFSHNPFPGFRESVPAYNTLTVYYDPAEVLLHAKGNNSACETVQATVSRYLNKYTAEPLPATKEMEIPVCYEKEFAPDIEWVARHCKLSTEELIRLHTGTVYRVYFIGFIPGFPYLGITDTLLEVPRKANPSLSVPAGSVALAGRQTGIYPFAIPGGWQIIGRTPCKMFDKQNPPYCFLQPGYQVRFRAITAAEFLQICEQ